MCKSRKEIKNNLENCICIDLDLLAKECNYNSQTPEASVDQVDLYLTVRFGEQTLFFEGCGITFGIKRGELRLVLKNAEIPLKNIHLTDIFSPKLEKKVQIEHICEEQEDINLSMNPGVVSGEKIIKKTSKCINIEDYQVKTKGFQDKISWDFETKDIRTTFLQGMMKDARISTINIIERPLILNVDFIIPYPGENIVITRLFQKGKDVSQNKKIKETVKKKLARLFLEKMIPICEGEIQYG